MKRADWDRFWTGQKFDDVVIKQNPEAWHELVWKVSLEYWHKIFKQLAPGERMLEYGCGSAKVSQYMALRGWQCTMLDYSEPALKLAQANFATLSLDGQFVLGDINQLSFAGNQFDVVYSGGVLEFFADIETAIREVVRVLRPGGLFAINIVPHKFSCQTLADFECTVAHCIRCLWKLRFKDIFKTVNHMPFMVSNASLQDYIHFCEAAGLESITGRCTSPFPALSLGRRGDQLYTHIMKQSLSQWQRFNQSRSRWTEIWGITYTIYGLKA